MANGSARVGTPQPYHLPGYSGHCPDVQYRLGAAFGLATHQAMCDPRVCHARWLALSRMDYQEPTEDYGAASRLALVNRRQQLLQEVQLLKGTRRPRSLADRMAMDCPRMPLSPVTVQCQGYKHPIE